MSPSVKLLRLIGLLVLGLLGQSVAVKCGGGGSRSCKFPALYNFGDSNSDTGAISATLSEVLPPNGESFFGKPAGRACDGRLVIDFIAEELRLPYLSPYMDSLGTNFRHGANFATGGSSIRKGGYSPFHLGVQIAQFMRFKSLSDRLTSNSSVSKGRLPRAEDFSKALYTFDIGQNDLAIGFQYSSEKQVQASIPDILGQLSQAIQQLYEEGARFFWVHNTGPIGCIPYNVIYYKSKAGNLDKNGCVKPQNAVAQEFNRQLKNMVLKLRTQLPLAVFTYVDVYSAKYVIVSRAKGLGFVGPMEFCCGSYYGYHIDCGKKAMVNGTLYGNPCKNPSKHISWDGIHYSQAANIQIANQILKGKLSDPLVPIGEACHYPKNNV
ncbi:GDSL esterase/lipase At3g27950 [Humulus lupulus]|uniref:GDSL esterase/lipase At3g27950 n=1 Tax=Humulus lupulus TaxID=3486 RepID=UPI002B4080BE|nr:GDSL esterase/lipase At3g27950 [Humulus lupulus]